MTPLEAMEGVFGIMALICYTLGSPNAGHFFMFMIVLTMLEGIRRKE